jgi:DNA-binding MarR family transcriptional regulator
MLAQASIAGAIILHTAIWVFLMRAYYRKSNYAMKNSVGYLMRMGVNRVLPQMEDMFEDAELTFSQWTTLVALHDGHITNASDLAHNICHDAGSLTRLLDQLEKRGFITRTRSKSDRRVITLALSPRGHAIVEALAPRIMDFWNKLLSGFSHAEVDTLIALLTRLMFAADDTPDHKSKLHLSTAPIFNTRKKAS